MDYSTNDIIVTFEMENAICKDKYIFLNHLNGSINFFIDKELENEEIYINNSKDAFLEIFELMIKLSKSFEKKEFTIKITERRTFKTRFLVIKDITNYLYGEQWEVECIGEGIERDKYSSGATRTFHKKCDMENFVAKVVYDLFMTENWVYVDKL